MDSLVKKIIEACLVEEFPTNAMGTSSSVAGSGPIDTFDPLLKFKEKARRKKPVKVKLKKG